MSVEQIESAKTKKKGIADQIINSITVGNYSPGQKLRENELAVKFSTSRAPVREALLELTSLGLVQQIPRRGFYVTKLSKSEIINSYVISGVLEGFALAQSINRFFEMDFLHLESLLEKMEESVRDGHNFGELSELDSQFHQYLSSKYENGLLTDFTGKASRCVAQYVYFKQWFEIQVFDQFHRRHRKILEVMQTKNQAMIEQTMREHYAEIGYRLAEHVELQSAGKKSDGR
jgi:Transcriptional regulators